MLERIFVVALAMIFIGFVLFIVLNTIMSEYIFPVMDNVANSSTILNETLNYDQRAEQFKSVFFIAFFIFLAIPFIYILVRILKKEPEPQYYGYGGGY